MSMVARAPTESGQPTTVADDVPTRELPNATREEVLA